MAHAQSIDVATEAELCDAVAAAAGSGGKLSIRGGGSKDAIGRDLAEGEQVLSLARISGVVDYDPPELVLTVRPGTLLSEVEALLASHNQMLAFAPFDHAPMLGGAAGRATIGGVVAAGISGSRRLSGGAARDHLLGFCAVSGRGEAFVAGGKVVKNVTGFDLCKLAAGSWGRLFALTEMTLKVLPAPQVQQSCMVAGLDAAQAVAAMSAAMGSAVSVAAAAHMPAEAVGPQACTVIQLDGFEPSVAARMAQLVALLTPFGGATVMDAADAAAFWREMRELSHMRGHGALWRVSTPARRAPEIVAAMAGSGARWAFDWAGGLVWLSGAVDADELRALAQQCGGHAMLVRGDAAMRTRVAAFHPQPRPVALLERRVRRAFDPAGVFETRRFADDDA